MKRLFMISAVAVLSVATLVWAAPPTPVYEAPCQPMPIEKVTLVDGGWLDGGLSDGGVGALLGTYVGTAVPASNQRTNRVWIEICVSPENSGSPSVKCLADGGTPIDMLKTSPGAILNKGDCKRYYNRSSVKCISDSTLTAVQSEECAATGIN
jgi:hypothetical protein